MPQRTRVPRKIDPTPAVTFDEQLWPINVALLVLGGFAAGAIIALSPFADPRPLYNGWWQLSSLVFSVGGLILLASVLDDRWMRRGVQLATLMSLIAHAGLLVFLYTQTLGTHPPQPAVRFARTVPEQETEVVLLAEYVVPDPEAPPEEFEKPVEVATEHQLPELIERQQTQPEEKTVAMALAPLTGTLTDAQPTPVKQREFEETAPRQASEASRYSKQTTHSLASVETPAEAPAMPSETSPQLNAQSRPDQPQKVATELKPAELEAQREPVSIQPVEPKREQLAAQPAVASPTAVERQTRAAASVDTQAPAPNVPRVAEVAPKPEPASAAVSASRRATQTVAPRSQITQDTGAVANTAVPRLVSPSELNQVPAIDARAIAAKVPNRAIRAAQTAVSPESIESPALAKATDGHRPLAEPRRTALARGDTGVFGGGNELNFERGAPSAASAAETPSIAARREFAAQNFAPGSDEQPSQPARVAKSIAMAEVPSTLLAATDLPGTTSGSQRPGQREATSSAAIRRAAADLPRARITGAVGVGELDLGLPSPASAVGGSRSSGGGAPSVATAVEGHQLAKSRGGSPLAAIVADAQAAAPQAPSSPSSSEPGPLAATTGSGRERLPASENVQLASVDISAGIAASGAPGSAAIGDPSIASGARNTAGEAAPGDGSSSDGVPGIPAVGNFDRARPLQKSGATGAAAPSALAELPTAPAGGAASEPGSNEPQPSRSLAGSGRQANVPVALAAPEGPGGLGAEVTPTVGTLSRQSQVDSQIVHAGTPRFLGRTLGGPLPIDGRAREPAEAFARRAGSRHGKHGGPGKPSQRTDETIELGLQFLAAQQLRDGRWSLNELARTRPEYEQEQASFQADTAATGLALLSFLGAGYDHYDDEYQQTVRAGLDFLISHQKPDGDLYLPMDRNSNTNAWLYSHGIAAIALCEAYGMTGDKALREPAQKAVNFIARAQDPRLGGWRYRPETDSDTSVSGWQLMALKSGELAGLTIPDNAYPNVRQWLNAAQRTPNDGSQYVYNPHAPRGQAHGRKPTPAMTAVGLLMRLYTGWDRREREMVAGAEHLLANLPREGTPDSPQRDTYYWYYATQVMFHMKGRYWKTWNEQLHPLLVESQVQTGPMAGSWDPGGAVPDRWGPQGGRIYVTTLNLLSLEVYYRHLPIYESTAR